jgi:hypothetical protein
MCAGAVYNVVDDDPASRGEVMAFARELLGLGSSADAVMAGESSGNAGYVDAHGVAGYSQIA